MCRLFLCLVLLSTAGVAAEPSVTEQSDLISMPDARLAPEGSWRIGLSFLRPYETLWSSVTILPWLEPTLRYTRIMHVPGFTAPGTDFGDFKDRSLDLKLRVFPEARYFPSVVLGVQDAIGTGRFRAQYAAASKKVGDFDLTVGYGQRRIDGLFGGVRWSPASLPQWSLVAEYDAYNYKRDFQAELSGAAAYKKGPALGVEYRWGWIGAMAFASHGQLGFNTYVSIPLAQREFVPKIDEPPPYTKINPRPTSAQWQADPSHRARLAKALHDQQFRDVRIEYENGALVASMANTRISSMPRAVGRAARTLLSFAPLEVREIRVTYVQAALPLATYTFINVPLLQRYFNGMATRQQLAEYVAIEYASPAAGKEQADRQETLAAFQEPLPGDLVISREDPDFISLRSERFLGGRVLVQPGLSAFLNDPSGAFRFDLSAYGRYDRPLGDQFFLNSEAKLTLYENVSGVTQPSNSLLPHVRSDVAEYKRGGKLKILRLLANKYYHLSERVYARASAGIYEEMFSGGGGQVLYMPRDGGWALDLATDWLRQRDFHGGFGLRPYTTATAIASLNYRLAQGFTATLRAGRFLAKDYGVRGELKRRFASGFEVGAWYTVTNGNDITTPGSPDHPYRDKGIFLSMPLETMLTHDTRATAGFALAPWTRDVGQMVASPGDLYRILERPVVEMHTADGLVRFGDREDDYDLPSLGTGRRDWRWPESVAEDAFSFGRAASQVKWIDSVVLGAGLVLASSALDNRAFRFADQRKDSDWVRRGVRLGNVLPLAGLGISSLVALDDSRPRLANTGLAALEAGALAIVASEAAKYAVGRARPTNGTGKADFSPLSKDGQFHSFPSRHVAVMWALVTPYAEEYGASWLYGLAAVTNAARIGSRKHWLSDTIAGALGGYALGHLAWEARRESRPAKNEPAISLGLQSVDVQWRFD